MKHDSSQQNTSNRLMLAGFEYWKSDYNLHWYFHLKAPNGGILVQSGVYLTEYECIEGIDMVRRFADVAIIEHQTSIT